jgi:diguanylate cyclase (GGDEF)-like protein/PAS domain S-box-containing protein
MELSLERLPDAPLDASRPAGSRGSATDVGASVSKVVAIAAVAAAGAGLAILAVGSRVAATAATSYGFDHTRWCAAALAVALFSFTHAGGRAWLPRAGRLLAAGVVALGLFGAASGLLGTGSLLVDEAGVDCALLGVALLLQERWQRPAVVAAQLLALAVLFSAQSSLLESWAGSGWFESLQEFRRVAASSAVVLALTAIGVLARSSGRGLLAVVLEDSPGAKLLRWLFPAAVLVPLGFGAIAIYSRRAGWVDVDLAETLMVMSTILVLMLFVAVLGAHLHETDLERAKAAEALRASEERYRLLAENGSDLVAVHDTDGRFTYVSPSCERILGFQREELLHSTPFALVHPEDVDRCQRHFRQLLCGEPATAIQCRLMHKTGRYVWLDIVWRPVHDSNGNVVALQSWSRDITEAREYQRRLEEAERRLRREQEMLAQANRQLAELAATDTLTGLRNRGAFEERLEEEVGRARRHGRPLSLLLLDIDRFKEYNDSFGHLAGDGVLRSVGGILARNVRATDFAARYGGEELAVILPDTESKGALELAERLRKAVENAPWTDRSITVSVGVASLGDGVESAKDLLDAADRALYRSKERGRNLVTISAGG